MFAKLVRIKDPEAKLKACLEAVQDSYDEIHKTCTSAANIALVKENAKLRAKLEKLQKNHDELGEEYKHLIANHVSNGGRKRRRR